MNKQDVVLDFKDLMSDFLGKKDIKKDDYKQILNKYKISEMEEEILYLKSKLGDYNKVIAFRDEFETKKEAELWSKVLEEMKSVKSLDEINKWKKSKLSEIILFFEELMFLLTMFLLIMLLVFFAFLTAFLSISYFMNSMWDYNQKDMEIFFRLLPLTLIIWCGLIVKASVWKMINLINKKLDRKNMSSNSLFASLLYKNFSPLSNSDEKNILLLKVIVKELGNDLQKKIDKYSLKKINEISKNVKKEFEEKSILLNDAKNNKNFLTEYIVDKEEQLKLLVKKT